MMWISRPNVDGYWWIRWIARGAIEVAIVQVALSENFARFYLIGNEQYEMIDDHPTAEWQLVAPFIR